MSYPADEGYQYQQAYEEYPASPAPTQGQMVSYSQQAAPPPQYNQNADQQQTSTTSTTTTTRTGYSVLQRPTQYVPTPQPAQYTPTSQPSQWQTSQDRTDYQYSTPPQPVRPTPAFQYPAQQPTSIAPVVPKADNDRQKPAKPADSSAVTKFTSATKMTTEQTIRTYGASQARQQAQAQGQAQLQQFEQKLQTLMASWGVCPMGFVWYRYGEGYLCGGRGHYISDGDIDQGVKYGHYPQGFTSRLRNSLGRHGF
ncbi:hypothetical protein LTR53_016747 [Teratosphaeriaceae sp. CCFEE 6253]|nr:hypothetical protein LTR53_016747 [Teratosphaeriaceae sp. CCFEE 6253]